MLAVFWCNFFFFYRNSIQTSGAIYFNLKCLQAVVCFFVLLCSVIVFIFHFYRVFVCFDTNLQINFTQFSGKILHRYYTDFSINFFSFQWKWVKGIFFMCIWKLSRFIYHCFDVQSYWHYGVFPSMVFMILGNFSTNSFLVDSLVQMYSSGLSCQSVKLSVFTQGR